MSSGDFERAVAAYQALSGRRIRSGRPGIRALGGRKRSHLARQFVEALLVLARGAQAAANHEVAIAYYRRAAAIDRFSATLTHAFMMALASAGDVTAALNVGRVHASLVQQELEAEPDARVQQLMRELRAGNVSESMTRRKITARRPQRSLASKRRRHARTTKRHVAPLSRIFLPPRNRSFPTMLKWLATTACLTLLASGASQATERTEAHAALQFLTHPPYRQPLRPCVCPIDTQCHRCTCAVSAGPNTPWPKNARFHATCDQAVS